MSDLDFENENKGTIKYSPENSDTDSRKGRKKRGGRTLALVLAGALIGSAIGGGSVGLALKLSSTQELASAKQYIDETVSQSVDDYTASIKIATVEEDTTDSQAAVTKTVYNEVTNVTTDYSTVIQNVAQTVSQSVVGVATSVGTGTGVIVSSDGLILTNQHVIATNDTTQMFRPNYGAAQDSTITVTLVDGTEYEAQILFQDEDMDIAVIKIYAHDLKAAALGDSDSLSVGEITVAIGNPLGLDQTVTSGIVSALDISINISESYNIQIAEDLIQTDVAINSGNSGGPLLNANGEVIGINSYKLSEGEGIGFAIPINAAKPIIEQIIQTGEFQQTALGVSVIDSEWLSFYETDIDLENGVYVYNVDTSSDTDTRDFEQGDIITKVDGVEVNTILELKMQLYKHVPGDTIILTVERGGSSFEMELTLS